MTVTALGLIVLALGLTALPLRPAMTIRTALCLSLLGSGAALSLPALGGASVLAGSLFSAMIVLRVLLLPEGPSRMLAALSPPAPGFWLMLAVLYGCFAAFFIAPLFEGRILVAPLARTTAEPGLFALQPLTRSTGNLTQSAYALGQLLLFAAMAAMLRGSRLRRIALDGLVLLAALHVLVSLLDLLTFFTGTGHLIDWLRSAGYTTWQGAALAGMKRISGLFPEASMYSIHALTICGILLALRLSHYRRAITGPLLLASLLLLIASTSSTAYAGLALALVLLLITGLLRLMEGRTAILRLLLGMLALLALGGAALVLIFPALPQGLGRLLEETVFTKIDSASGRERSLLNAAAYQAFVESAGLGLGLGSVRTSSFLMTLLSNLGLPGTLAFTLFVLRCTLLAAPLARPGDPPPAPTDLTLRRAARMGMTGCLIGAAVSLHVFELGTLFYILAAFSLPIRAPRPLPHPRRLHA